LRSDGGSGLGITSVQVDEGRVRVENAACRIAMGLRVGLAELDTVRPLTRTRHGDVAGLLVLIV
jgi:hypothetical protein